jgi:hypothetical protein
MTIQAHSDDAGMVEAIEVYRPSDDSVDVVYNGVSVFAQPIDVVEESLARILRLEVVDEGMTVVAPDLFLAFGKSLSVYAQEVDSGYFESVVVARPGYYPTSDRSAEAESAAASSVLGCYGRSVGWMWAS